MTRFTTYHSQIYRDFKVIAVTDYRALVHYYENYEKVILELEFDEYFEILIAYTDALFETGAYRKHELMADVVIEASIDNNIHIYNGEDIYFKTLFRKAASLYNLAEYPKAVHILKELIRMEPTHEDSVSFLKKCLYREHTVFLKNTRAAAMICFLLTPVVISVQEIIVQPFYQELAIWGNWIRNSIFAVGWLILAGGDLVHRWQSSQAVDSFLKHLPKGRKKEVERV